jgi:hypothetical protein
LTANSRKTAQESSFLCDFTVFARETVLAGLQQKSTPQKHLGQMLSKNFAKRRANARQIRTTTELELKIALNPKRLGLRC